MLPQGIKVGMKESSGFDPIPADVYSVELLDVSSVVHPTYDTRNSPPESQEMETIFNFQFVLLEGQAGEKNLRGLSTWANFVPSYFYISKKNGKNRLFKIIEALIGHDVGMQEYSQMENDASSFLNALIGKQCRVVIEHVQKGDKTYANPISFMKTSSLLQPLNPEEKEKAKIKKNKEERIEENKLNDIAF